MKSSILAIVLVFYIAHMYGEVNIVLSTDKAVTGKAVLQRSTVASKAPNAIILNSKQQYCLVPSFIV